MGHSGCCAISVPKPSEPFQAYFCDNAKSGTEALAPRLGPRLGVERIMRFAFRLAQSRPRKLLTVVTIAAEIASEFKDVTWDKMLVDAMTVRMAMRPQTPIGKTRPGNARESFSGNSMVRTGSSDRGCEASAPGCALGVRR
jgi:hypothetical protein